MAMAVALVVGTGVAIARADLPKNQVFKSWTLECVQPQAAQGASTAPKPFCRVSHEVHSPNDQTKIQLVARARYLGADRKPWFLLILPPSANLQKGIRLQVDKNTAYQAKIYSCNQQECSSGFPLSDDILKQFRTGTELKLEFLINPQSDMKLSVPLAGFGAALDALQKTGA